MNADFQRSSERYRGPTKELGCGSSQPTKPAACSQQETEGATSGRSESFQALAPHEAGKKGALYAADVVKAAYFPSPLLTHPIPWNRLATCKIRDTLALN
jgi:hypothetical protein